MQPSLPYGGLRPPLMLRQLRPAAHGASSLMPQGYSGVMPYQFVNPGSLVMGGGMAGQSPFGMTPPPMMQQQRQPQQQQQQQQQQQRATTLYVGNITKLVDNDFMRNLLGEFGRVIRWNRQSDPVSGQLAAFGFCEFADPVGAAKCLSCLSGLKLQGRALVVNCNEKVRAEIARVEEERIVSTMRAFKHRSREQVTAELQEDERLLKSAIEDLLSKKNAQLPEEEDTEPTDPKVAPPPQPPEPQVTAGGAAGAAAPRGATGGALAGGGGIGGPEAASPAATAASAAFHRLRKLDPEAIAAAAENSIYRIAPDGTDRRTYIDEDYRPSRRELERLQNVARRAAEYEREFSRRESAWRIQEQQLAVEREQKLVGEREIGEEDKRQLVEQDMRGVWWEGLEDPQIRQERRRRRREEAQDDEKDLAAELKELAAAATKGRAGTAGGGAMPSSCVSTHDSEGDQEGTAPSRGTASGLPAHRREGGGRDREKERESQRLRNGDRDKTRDPGRHKTAGTLENNKESPRSALIATTRANSGGGSGSGSSRRAAKDLRKFFDDEEDGALAEGRKHKPLTKLDDHRDVVNKVNKVKETMEVIEHSKKILALVPTDKAELFAYQVDWTLLMQKNIMERKLRPWVRKKVIEFMGAEEELVQEVIDYILKRVGDKPDPRELLDELCRFLDDEAEGFLKHMWRLLIFEQLKLQKA